MGDERSMEIKKLHFDAADTDKDGWISYNVFLLVCIIASYIYVIQNASVTHFLHCCFLVVARRACIMHKATYLVFISFITSQCQDAKRSCVTQEVNVPCIVCTLYEVY
jgi:hypothetical protein